MPYDDRFVTVARYDTTGEAKLAKARLEDADIPCMLANAEQSGLAMMFDASLRLLLSRLAFAGRAWHRVPLAGSCPLCCRIQRRLPVLVGRCLAG